MTDSEFINSPMEWPRWPCLPLVSKVKRSYDKHHVGFILARETPPYIVYLDNYMSAADRIPKPKTWSEVVKGMETLQYDTVEALLKEWRID